MAVIVNACNTCVYVYSGLCIFKFDSSRYDCSIWLPPASLDWMFWRCSSTAENSAVAAELSVNGYRRNVCQLIAQKSCATVLRSETELWCCRHCSRFGFHALGIVLHCVYLYLIYNSVGIETEILTLIDAWIPYSRPDTASWVVYSVWFFSIFAI